MKKGTSEQSFALVIIAPALILVFGVVIFPFVQTLIYSFQDMSLMSANQGQFVGLANYIGVLSSQEFWYALGRTMYFTLTSTLLETTLGLFVALLLNETFIGVKFLRTIVILPWAMPTIVNASLWKWIYNGEYGLLNAVLSKLHLISDYQSWLSSPLSAMNMVVIADAWKMTPLAAIFFLAALQITNKSSYEAAMVDGAGVIKRFFVLTLPYLKPTLLVVLVMRTVEKFKAFDIFFMITKGGPANGTKVLMYEAYQRAFTNLEYSQASTYAYLIAAIIGLMTLAYLKILKRDEESYD